MGHYFLDTQYIQWVTISWTHSIYNESLLLGHIVSLTLNGNTVFFIYLDNCVGMTTCIQSGPRNAVPLILGRYRDSQLYSGSFPESLDNCCSSTPCLCTLFPSLRV